MQRSSFNQALDFEVEPAVLGDAPVPTHVLISSSLKESHTFQLYKTIISQQGVDAQFLPFECAPDDLDRVRELFSIIRKRSSLTSIMVSDPFKSLASELVDTLTPRAFRAGVVNLVLSTPHGIEGDNLDGVAFNLGARELHNVTLEGRHVAFFGCGGVSTAVSLENANAAAHIGLCDVVSDRPLALQQRILSANRNAKVSIIGPNSMRNLSEYDVLYNGTGLGKRPRLNESPLHSSDIIDANLFIDAIYTPSETRFLEQRRKLGARVINGLSHMLASTALHCSIICRTEISLTQVYDAYCSLHAASDDK
jgi:shikimate 5-dehydrogenase